MKLKIVLLTLISLPVWSSERPTRPASPTFQMPNEATVLAILNSNNEGNTFTNLEHNQTIAKTLADQRKYRREIVSLLFEITQSTKVVELSLKASHLIDGAKFVADNANFRQEYMPKNSEQK